CRAGSLTRRFDWADDKAGNTPCLVAAAVVGGYYDVPILTSGVHYNTPGENGQPINSCTCSWAAYNLYSACTACQGLDDSILTNFFQIGGQTIRTNCGAFLSNTTYYPSNVVTLDNTSIPYYATTNPSTWTNAVFTVTQAQNISEEGFPDVYGAPLTSSTPSSPSSHKSNAAAIGGGVAGGVVVLLIGALLAWWILRKRELDSTVYGAGHTRSYSDLTKTSNIGDMSFGSGSGNVGTINMQQLQVPGFSPSPFGSSSNMASVSSMGAFSTPPHQVIQVGGDGGARSLYGNASTITSRYDSPSPSLQFMNRSYSPDSNGHSFVGGAEMIAQPFLLPPTSTSPPPPSVAASKARTRRMNPPAYDDVALSDSRDVAAQRREAHGTGHVGGPPVRPRLDEKRRPSEVSETSLGSQDSSIWTTSVGNGNISYVGSNAPTADLAAIDAFVNQMDPRPALSSRRYTVNTTVDDGNESVLEQAGGDGDRDSIAIA
ncbi:hypothetical protein BT96DRAFT_926188, partial [Gymnopus androsaceus JB14]